MKSLSSIVLGPVLILTFQLNGQIVWGPTVRLTESPTWSYLPYNNARCIAASGEKIHVIWGEASSTPNVWYKHSTDEGKTWGEARRISNSPRTSDYPSLAVSDSNIHVVWRDDRDGYEQIYYKRSIDNGETWGQDVRLTGNPVYPSYPSIATSDTAVHLVWQDLRDGNLEIYYKRSLDNGLTWSEDIRLTNGSGNSEFPSVEAQGSNVYVVWNDNLEGNFEIYYTHSLDNGETWGEYTRLTKADGISEHPSLVAEGSRFHLAWSDQRPGNPEIYYKNSTDAGATWSEDNRLSYSAGNSLNPSLVVSDSNIFISWHDTRDGNFEIYFINSTDLGATWSADTNLSAHPASSYSPFVALTDTTVHLIWHDDREGNHEIFYKQGKFPSKPEPGCEESNTPGRLMPDAPPIITSRLTLGSTLQCDAEVSLVIYDAAGRQVQTLVSERQPAGSYTVRWNVNNYLSQGVYFCTLKVEGFTATRKTVLLK